MGLNTSWGHFSTHLRMHWNRVATCLALILKQPQMLWNYSRQFFDLMILFDWLKMLIFRSCFYILLKVFTIKSEQVRNKFQEPVLTHLGTSARITKTDVTGSFMLLEGIFLKQKHCWNEACRVKRLCTSLLYICHSIEEKKKNILHFRGLAVIKKR